MAWYIYMIIYSYINFFPLISSQMSHNSSFSLNAPEVTMTLDLHKLPIEDDDTLHLQKFPNRTIILLFTLAMV